MNKHFIYPIILLLLVFDAYAQERVSGIVTSAEDNQPLPGVSVIIKGTSSGTVTDVDGRYILEADNNAEILIFSYIGYEKQEIPINNRSVIDVSMKTDVDVLDEVVVVAYGEVRKRDLTGSVSSIKSEDLAKASAISIDQALQGRAAGVNVTQVSGSPGGETSIRIRGSSSITAGNEPLYVVDGVIINSSPGAMNAGGMAGANLNPLSALNPGDIESIEILKDASAAALYGARATNGVVLITTKGGRMGKGSVTVDSYYGVQEVTKKLDVLNGEEFAHYINDLREDRGLPADVRYLVPEKFGEGTDWQEAIFRMAPMQSHLLTLSGGDDKTQYSVSGSYFKQDGIIINSDFERGTFRTNLDREISEKLNVGTRINLSRINSRGVLTGARSPGTGNLLPGAVSSALLFPPTLPVYDEDGPGGYTYEDDRNRNLANPVADALETDNMARNTRIIANIFGVYEIVDGLNLKASLGWDEYSVKENRFVPNFLKRTQPNNGEAIISTIDGQTWLTEFTLSYSKEINEDHQFDALVGHTRQGYYAERLTAVSLDFTDNRIGWHNISAGLNPQPPSSGESEYGIISYLGRINYKLQDRYIVTLSSRVDGSSKFGADNKYGFFPSAAIAWNMSDTEFVANSEFIDYIKPRASYGILGNSDIVSYASLATVGPFGEGTFTNDEPYIGVEPLRLANPNLRWERTSQFDLGVDVALLKSRLLFTADYYFQNTTDLLLNTPIPRTTGFASYYRNVGGLQNQGIELALDGVIVEVKNFNWQSNFNFSLNRNKITSLPEGEILAPGIAGIGSGWSIYREGEPLGSFYGYISDGIFQSDAEAQNSPRLIVQDAVAGERRYRDINGRDSEGNLTGEPDGIINEADRVIIGSAQPKFTWNFTNTLSYKGIELTFLIQAVEGNHVLNAMRFELETLNGETNVFREAYINRWTEDNPSTIYRKMDPSDPTVFSTAQLEDGSFIRIRNVNLAYNFTGKLLDRMGLHRLRAYVTVNNLKTFTDYSGYDPEVNAFGQNRQFLGVDYGGYPLARTMVFGLQVGL